MTDAEKELRRLAEDSAAFGGVGSRVERIRTKWNNTYEDRFTDAATPAAVLALLDRIEALEKACASAHRELYEGNGSREAALEAEGVLAAVIP